MNNPAARHALAVPDTPEFRAQMAKMSEWVVGRLEIHWLIVSPDGRVEVIPPMP